MEGVHSPQSETGEAEYKLKQFEKHSTDFLSQKTKCIC